MRTYVGLMTSPALAAPAASLPRARVLGIVELSIEGQNIALPVQALRFAGAGQDGAKVQGGFFVDRRGALGIVVDENLPAEAIDACVREAASEAVRYLSLGTSSAAEITNDDFPASSPPSFVVAGPGASKRTAN